MVWTTETEVEKNAIWYNDEKIFEKAGALTAEDVKNAARQVGIQGKFDVYDYDTGEELTPSDFPYNGDIEIEPRHTAA